MIEELSKQLDLSSSEAKVYATLLIQGSVTSGTIAKETKFRTSTIYHILNKLLDRGLITFTHKSKVKYFQITPPEAYLDALEEKRSSFKNFLPKLKTLQSPASPRTAKVYEGVKGLRAAFSDILNSLNKGDTYYFFQAPEVTLEAKDFLLFIRNYHLKRVEKGIKVKGLALPSCNDVIENTFEYLKFTEIRFVEAFIPHGLIIYNDKVITLDWHDEPTAFVIQSETVAKNYKNFFESSWLNAKK